jgi:hypothetical protein
MRESTKNSGGLLAKKMLTAEATGNNADIAGMMAK